jgi:hypothetical protein
MTNSKLDSNAEPKRASICGPRDARSSLKSARPKVPTPSSAHAGPRGTHSGPSGAYSRPRGAHLSPDDTHSTSSVAYSSPKDASQSSKILFISGPLKLDAEIEIVQRGQG